MSDAKCYEEDEAYDVGSCVTFSREVQRTGFESREDFNQVCKEAKLHDDIVAQLVKWLRETMSELTKSIPI